MCSTLQSLIKQRSGEKIYTQPVAALDPSIQPAAPNSGLIRMTIAWNA